ncbi:MAG: FAD-binding oxidoreductase [Syntrophaceae bacterium]|nr:FAD-binding oxidoreductase [Syntrophaceae bacterium]
MSKMDKLFSKLKEIVGEANVIQDLDQLKGYTIDGKKPRFIVFPGKIEEVSRVVALANQQHLHIIPRGNGTKMEMGGIPKKMDILLSTRRLNRITDNDCENLTLSAECGITLNEVQKSLAKIGKGYFLPLDPPFTEKATLGGIIATNSSGPKRLLYGTARDLIIGTKSVFPNGDIVVSGGKTVKNVSGYDMCKLLIGSHGTLGVLCEMTFKLLPLPEKEATLMLSFAKLEDANGFAHQVRSSQLIPSAMEILNAKAIQHMRYSMTIHSDLNYMVAVALEGVTESIDRQIAEMKEMGKKYGVFDAMSLDSGKHLAFWNALRDFSLGLAEHYPNVVSLKSNFLISRCGEILRSYETITEESGTDCAYICHAGNGILYTYLLTGKSLKSKLDTIVELIGRLTTEAVKNEGNLVVESSPLSIKKKVDVWGQSRSDHLVVRRLKEQIDPAGIFNVGRFVGGI